MNLTRIVTAILATAAGLAILTGCGAPKTTMEDDGVYVVGTDVAAATYHAVDPRKFGDDPADCRWTTRMNGSVQVTESWIGLGGPPARMAILLEGMEFTTSHCGPWTQGF